MRDTAWLTAIAENADLAVDELKRKARRRLVGAIVLALAAAIILPLLLEQEPKPLGDDVSVQIPPVDEGKFVNRLTGRASETKSSAKPRCQERSQSRPHGRIEVRHCRTGSVPQPSRPPRRRNAASAAAAPATTAVASGAAPNDVAPPKKSARQAEQRVLSPANKPANKPDATLAAPSKTDSVPATPGTGAGKRRGTSALRRSPRSSPPTLATTAPATASPRKQKASPCSSPRSPTTRAPTRSPAS